MGENTDASLLAIRALADKWWHRLHERIRREVSVLDIEVIVRDAYSAGAADALRRSGEALRRLQEEKDAIERELRELWWMGHGCVTALYGDDGEMQCGRHCLDFKRMPLDELREEVRKIKWQRLVESEAARQSGAEGTEAGGRSQSLAPTTKGIL